MRSVPAILAGVGGILLTIISLIGFTWVQFPADPTAGTPSSPADFGAMGTATEGSPSGIQSSYFSWLAWVLVILLLVLVVAILMTGRRAVAVAGAGLAAVGIALTFLALKGPNTLSQAIDAVSTLRIGSYLMFVGLIILVIFGVVAALHPSAPNRSATSS